MINSEPGMHQTVTFMGCSLAASASGAAGCVFFSLYPDLDNIGGSADTRIDGYCFRRAVAHTGPAFHARIEINDMGFFFPYFKNRVRAYRGAKAASDALFFVEHQCGYII